GETGAGCARGDSLRAFPLGVRPPRQRHRNAALRQPRHDIDPKPLRPALAVPRRPMREHNAGTPVARRRQSVIEWCRRARVTEGAGEQRALSINRMFVSRDRDGAAIADRGDGLARRSAIEADALAAADAGDDRTLDESLRVEYDIVGLASQRRDAI